MPLLTSLNFQCKEPSPTSERLIVLRKSHINANRLGKYFFNKISSIASSYLNPIALSHLSPTLLSHFDPLCSLSLNLIYSSHRVILYCFPCQLAVTCPSHHRMPTSKTCQIGKEGSILWEHLVGLRPISVLTRQAPSSVLHLSKICTPVLK